MLVIKKIVIALAKTIAAVIALIIAIAISMIISHQIEVWFDDLLWKQEFIEQGFEYPEKNGG